jgi:hypothetical protein
LGKATIVVPVIVYPVLVMVELARDPEFKLSVMYPEPPPEAVVQDERSVYVTMAAWTDWALSPSARPNATVTMAEWFFIRTDDWWINRPDIGDGSGSNYPSI